MVDDTSSNRKMLEMVLKTRQIKCDMAEDGQQAVDMVKDYGDEYDFIFMDFTMPGRSMHDIVTCLSFPSFCYPHTSHF